MAAICSSITKLLTTDVSFVLKYPIELTKERIEGVHVEHIEISVLPMFFYFEEEKFLWFADVEH